MKHAQEGSDEKFRLFLSSDPAKNIPIGILSRCIKIRNEPPTGLKANLKRAWSSFSRDLIQETESKSRSIIFGLCYFHSVLTERKKFGPKGFNMMYPFSLGDLRDSSICLLNYMENAPSKIPWEDLKYIFGQIIYGGHIVNDWDRLLAMTYLDFFMKDALLDESELMPFCEQERGVSFMSPQPTTYDAYLKHIDETLSGDTPLAFGMHTNAEIGFRTDQSESMFQALQELQPQTASSNDGGDDDEGSISPAGVAEQVLNDIVDRFGDKKFDMEDIDGSIDDKGPYQNVFLQECEAFNVIIDEMMRSLLELNQGLAGELTMSDKMEKLQGSLFMDRVPGKWESLAWASMRTLSMWLNDLGMRYEQLLDWTGNPAEIPRLVWISGFRNPQSFLTAIKQISAQATNQPLDRMVTLTEVTKKTHVDELESHSRDGAYIHGFYIEGARWNISNGVVEPSKPKEMFLQMPIINVKSILSEKQDLKSYQCPCYKTRQRGPTFIFVAQLKTKDPAARWIMAGVALLSDIE